MIPPADPLVLCAVGGLVVALCGAASYLLVRAISSRFVTAKPNEWCLVIKNGQLLASGVGLTVFRGLFTQVVTFPTTLQEVKFKATQVTSEMQGIEVSGFVTWVIFSKDKGPWKAYQNLPGLASGHPAEASQQISQLAESIIRCRVANNTIDSVLKSREQLRDQIRTEIQQLLQGWGVWLETVEITDVRILSQSLFEDLQAQFRQEAHKAAETKRLQIANDLQKEKLHHEKTSANWKADNDLEKSRYALKCGLEREREEERVEAEKLAMRQERLRREQQLKEMQFQMSKDLADKEAAAGRERHRLDLEQESSMSDLSVRLYTLKTCKKIYKALPIKDVRLVSVGEGQSVEKLVSSFVGAFQGVNAGLVEK